MLYIVGLGPGSLDLMSPMAQEVLQKVDTIVGYTTYIKLVKDFIQDKEVINTGMKREIDRCEKAIELAQAGKEVAVISSGDAGIYGMAGLILELLSSQGSDLEVKVVPGITASIGGAALLGAPLMNDFCHISLSDLMTPWEMIEKRLHAAAQGDFVICLYNPKSKGRPKHLEKALKIIAGYKGEETIVGIAKDIGRPKEETIITTIKDLDDRLVDMTTTVIVGNRFTKVYNGMMYTPRGYKL
ncbi:precorrin-3B C(17)-methyltransferase [Facklamia sp. DSM 111018]|uniref:Precorrin-3B C(17)-methyltransferase n=1 Tax=Facklamia lactis TaxID=2749967 RepID=A0ABS0LNX1_9LACT|nr:precorrin-3B C(17)-methyltransferase [Facklamia lactis]MBG9979501.1 precorrin-3B C(17)-methyltransferase [Facklamia lactis]MBG9985829.1 precorrin-3B C(17)-methyltransferase [Facklamia lactis]